VIALTSIKTSIYRLLKSKYPDYKVHFDNVEKAEGPYFYVEFTPSVNSVDDVYSDRTIDVGITFFLPQDENGRIKRSTLYDVADSLDLLIRPTLELDGKRYIYIDSADINFVDDVLHYDFAIVFTDAFTDEEVGGIKYELMQTLGLRINNEDWTEEE
jgi:hypothetical protein